MREPRSMTIGAGLLANVLVIGLLGYIAALNAYDPDLYYRTVQEDEYLEWATFWSFVLAAAVCTSGAMRQRRIAGVVPWYFCGVALFCIFVALEEISWGQRLLGYRPPTYFLEHNFQQELNLHNVADTSTRKLALRAVLLGYGVLLPAATLLSPLRRLLTRVGVVAPPLELAPAFVAMLVVYVTYPWKYSGEVVELMMGLGFLFAALVCARGPLSAAEPEQRSRGSVQMRTLAGAWALVFALGFVNAAASRVQRSADPAYLELAKVELEALKKDLLDMTDGGRLRFSPVRNLHKRVYTYVEKYERDHLYEGDFSKLTRRGLPEERADFFLDPWNAPYWINVRWSDDNKYRTVIIYSFGPNRRRESTHVDLGGDDVGILVVAGAY